MKKKLAKETVDWWDSYLKEDNIIITANIKKFGICNCKIIYITLTRT